MYDENSENDQAGNLDEERSELPEPWTLEASAASVVANEFAVPQTEPETHSTADLIAIYSLLKAGFTAEDF